MNLFGSLRSIRDEKRDSKRNRYLRGGVMKIQKTIELNELDFLKNIQFYGDTNLDKRTVERIEELKELFSSVLYELYILDTNISDRKEKSANDIRASLKEMRKTLLSDLAVYENIDVSNSTELKSE